MTARSCTRLAVFCALALAPAAQTTWFVDDDGLGGTGTAAEPFCTIQEGIDAALPGDLVLVLPGTYFELIDFLGKDITVRSAEGPAVTVIDGSATTGSVVTFQSGESNASVLEGFTIQQGYASGGGGGIYCQGASPTIAYNVIADNLTNDFGGGLHFLDAPGARVFHNIVESNVSFPGGGMGGGLYALNSDLEISGNIFRFNDAWGDPFGYGGGLYLFGGSATIEHNLIARNTAIDYGGNEGGGILMWWVDANLNGNTIVDNLAWPGDYSDGFGGGIAFYGGSSSVRIKNSILWGNSSTQGRQMYVGSGLAGIAYSNVEGGTSGCLASGGSLTWGDGNLLADPLFVDPLVDDYHLLPSSPLVDAGLPTEAPGGIDADGDPRRLDGRGAGCARVDIGWDEVNRTVLTRAGNATLGGTLALTTSTFDPHYSYVLVLSVTPGDLSFGPLGSLLLDLASLQILAFGVAPDTYHLTLPSLPALAGTELYTQSLAIAYTGAPGSFSNRLRFVLTPTAAP